MESFENIVKKSYAFNPAEYRNDFRRWNILEELYNENFVKVNGQGEPTGFPKKIHQIWVGSMVPEKYDAWRESWQKYHPDWEYRLWTDEDLDEIDLPNRDLYDAVNNYGAKSDILRYYLLYKYGGLYVDTDFECLKPFDSLRYLDFLIGIGYPSKTELYVGLIASVPKHPILERMVEAINKVTNVSISRDILSATSSYFFTKNFFDVVPSYQPKILALPTDYIYPLPNKKNIQISDRDSFILPSSYAIHYWEVSWAVGIAGRDWVIGERFKDLADFKYAPRERHRDDYDHLENTFDPNKINKPVTSIYTHTIYVRQLFNILRHLSGKYVVISHNSDVNVDDTFDVPDNVLRWFTQNVATKNPKVHSLPIGLENTMWDQRNNKRRRMVEELKREKRIGNLAYLGAIVKTNPAARQPLYTLFREKIWVTAENGKTPAPFNLYLNRMYNHKFVFCPDGNGIDTHRLWETLYLGSIPIVKRSLNTRFYEDLPICFVDEWEEVTEEFLNKEYERIKSGKWNLAKMNFGWWSKLIRKACSE